MVRDALHAPEARERAIFDPAVVDRLLAEPNERHTRVGGNVLWQVGLLELWLQHHGVGGRSTLGQSRSDADGPETAQRPRSHEGCEAAVAGEGFEPPEATPADLQSDPFGR